MVFILDESTTDMNILVAVREQDDSLTCLLVVISKLFGGKKKSTILNTPDR